MSFQKYILIFLFILLLGGGVALLVLLPEKSRRANENGACTLEAMLCPDGSYVGRIPPACEFAPCPKQADPTENWKTFSNPQMGVSFRYPENLGTKYITLTDWPPKISREDKSFSCMEGGETNAPAGKTQKRIIGEREYCVTERTEGAAGSIYSLYAYAFEKDRKIITLTFGLRMSQCGNYSEEEMAACEKERRDFNLDTTIGKIGETLF